MKPALLAPLVLAAALLASQAPAVAQTASGQPYLAPGVTESLITDPADKSRYDRLAHELRCLVCQNQTLAESDASLAADLRRQVESMIVAGQSNEQIKSFLVERYGDFVLYRPPVQSNTWLLWFGPFALLAVGAGIWVAINRRRRIPVAAGAAGGASPPAGAMPEAGGAPSAADLERVRRLLDGD
jgi:cytochrome c-type biogenesis protein CcmH